MIETTLVKKNTFFSKIQSSMYYKNIKCVIFKSHIIQVYLNYLLHYHTIRTCINILAAMNTLKTMIYITKD